MVMMMMMMMMMMPVAVCCLLFTGGDDNDDGGFFKKMVHVETPISLANRFSQVGWLHISIISNDEFSIHKDPFQSFPQSCRLRSKKW